MMLSWHVLGCESEKTYDQNSFIQSLKSLF